MVRAARYQKISLHDVLNAEDPTVTSISDAILGETRNSSIGGPTYAEALGLQLSVHLLRNYADVKFRRESTASLAFQSASAQR